MKIAKLRQRETIAYNQFAGLILQFSFFNFFS